MKLIIQIPCYNEDSVIAFTVSQINKKVPGFEKVEILIIDDGSSDNTVSIAKNDSHIDHVIRMPRHRGLAKAFMAGLEASLNLGADVIVNLDADNQYNAADIEKLVFPILDGRADIAIGSRMIDQISHFSPLKKYLQKLGSKVMRVLSGTDVQDATSGFRALSRQAAMRINIFSEYTYTLEMLMQARQKNLMVIDVPIRVNAYLRPSKLVKNNFSYIFQSVKTMVHMFVSYKPFKFFFTIGGIIFLIGTILGIRYLWEVSVGEGKGHIQIVILSAVFLITGFFVILVAFMTNIMSTTRQILEDIQYMLRSEKYKNARKD